ncbi:MULTISPECIES: DUF2750 domain-containing protein [unclassified Micromonospora]|uniref:DUF2750 domain-containing protein n=1 Tax=unclassified Micromonospora TaxID=2617518 RepID=UPI0022C8CF68|nr:DUF2750 domain-containing protein [Micromonospora sp. AKA38]GHJ16034.1 hypothetical protein TPA0908_40290 [Micromonospora sp. AKA38]
MRDAQGSPAPKTSSGTRAMPYWSSQAGAQRAADVWGNDLRPVPISLEAWRKDELPELANEAYRIGLNWTGPLLATFNQFDGVN